jgi:ABC-2 type transport system ATP-binding protein
MAAKLTLPGAPGRALCPSDDRSARPAEDVSFWSRQQSEGHRRRPRYLLHRRTGGAAAFIGPNGAGKSTSIKILTGILTPTGGEAMVLGIVPWKERRRLASRIGTLFGQRSMLWSELTPRQSYRMLAAIYNIDSATERHRVGELTHLLGATDLVDSPVRTLSLGPRMRCELTAAMLHQPEILFLDEPTIGLDLLAKQLFRELLVRVNEESNTTIFLTSHDVADIEHVARRAIVVTR